MIGDTKLEILKRNLRETPISTIPVWEDPLEELFQEAQAKAPTKAHSVPKGRGVESNRATPPTTPQVLFTNPENWERIGGVALVHEETQTLLGNFSEYRHRTVKHAKKLLREETPISVTRTESVKGSWWLGADRTVMPHSLWHETRKALIKIHLPDLGVFTPLAEVAVQLSHGGIARVELIEQTLFADSDGKELLTLPAGLNVLPAMSLDSKIDLRKEIGL